MSPILVPSKRIWTRQPQSPVRHQLPFNAFGVSYGGWGARDAFSDNEACALTGKPTRVQLSNRTAYRFSGTSQAMLLPNPAWLDLTKPFTVLISFSVQKAKFSRILTLADAAKAFQFTLQDYRLAIVHGNSRSETTKATANTPVVVNTLYNAVVCFDGSAYSLYLDGELQSGPTITRVSCVAGGTQGMHLARRNDLTSYAAVTISDAVFVQGVLGNPRQLSENPWQMFRPMDRQTIFAPAASGNLAAQASGASQSSGSADLQAQVALAGVGVSLASGQTTTSVAIPLSAAGISVAGGSANGIATVSLSAAGLAQAAGQAGLSASVLLAAAGAAQAAGNTALAALLSAQAAGAGQAGGSANLTGGAPGALNASGGDLASGSAVLSVSVKLQATGAGQAGGSASGSASAPGQIAASGGSQSAGAATVSATVTLTAAGFVQAMGVGQFTVQVPLQAVGQAISTGQAVMTSTGLMVSAPSGCASYQQIRHPALQAGFRGFNASGFRAPNIGGNRISR